MRYHQLFENKKLKEVAFVNSENDGVYNNYKSIKNISKNKLEYIVEINDLKVYKLKNKNTYELEYVFLDNEVIVGNIIIKETVEIGDHSEYESFYFVKSVFILPDYRKQNTITKFYKWFINNNSAILMSGDSQTPSGIALWNKLFSENDIKKWLFDKHKDKAKIIDKNFLEKNNKVIYGNNRYLLGISAL